MDKVISLKMNTQFQKLYKKGKSCVAPSCVIYVRRNGLGYNRLGITAGKKIGNAVVRNRAKRRLRELFRIRLPYMKTGFDFVAVARMRTASAPYEKLAADFDGLLKTAGVLCDAPCD